MDEPALELEEVVDHLEANWQAKLKAKHGPDPAEAKRRKIQNVRVDTVCKFLVKQH